MSNALTPIEAIPQLEEFWDLPGGYFYKLRQGDYEAGGAGRFEALLRSIAVNETTTLPRRFVSLTWIVPTFMEWQIERVLENGGDVDALKQDITTLRNVLNDMLGAP